jgi:hypothetical protein
MNAPAMIRYSYTQIVQLPLGILLNAAVVQWRLPKMVNQWTSGVVRQNDSFSDGKAQLDDKPINPHSS